MMLQPPIINQSTAVVVQFSTVMKIYENICRVTVSVERSHHLGLPRRGRPLGAAVGPPLGRSQKQNLITVRRNGAPECSHIEVITWGYPFRGRPRVRLLALPGLQTEADSDQTLEADAGHRRKTGGHTGIRFSQAVLNRIELFT